jgi:hypothetical protein
MESERPDDDARETLAQLEQRLRREVADMTTVLVADVPMFFSRAVRRAFERSPAADDLDDAAVAKLKAAAQEASQAQGARVGEELAPFEVWLPQGPVDPGQGDLSGQPAVAAVLDRVGADLAALLTEHGLGAEVLGDEASYRLPSYFVKGHFMKSLVGNYWRALADYVALREQVQEESQADQRERRRARWDEA